MPSILSIGRMVLKIATIQEIVLRRGKIKQYCLWIGSSACAPRRKNAKLMKAEEYLRVADRKVVSFGAT